jgi:hypothetical protein
MKSILIVSELAYLVSKQAMAKFFFDVRPNLKVGVVLETLIAHGRHRYEFTPSGKGRRRWTLDRIELLYNLGAIINAAQVSAVVDDTTR